MLGYPPNQKAYRVYDLESKKILVSRDVVFKENIFPFKQQVNEGNEQVTGQSQVFLEDFDEMELRQDEFSPEMQADQETHDVQENPTQQPNELEGPENQIHTGTPEQSQQVPEILRRSGRASKYNDFVVNMKGMKEKNSAGTVQESEAN